MPLLHLLTHRCDVNEQILFLEILSYVDTSGNFSHLDGSTGDSSIALSVVLVNVDLLVFGSIGDESLFVEFLGFNGVALVLYLRGKSSADVLFSLWSDLLGQLECCEPILQVHSHFKGEARLGTLHEALLGQVVSEKDRSNMSHEDVLLSFVLDALDSEHHANVLAHLESGFSKVELKVLQTDLAK